MVGHSQIDWVPVGVRRDRDMSCKSVVLYSYLPVVDRYRFPLDVCGLVAAVVRRVVPAYSTAVGASCMRLFAEVKSRDEHEDLYALRVGAPLRSCFMTCLPRFARWGRNTTTLPSGGCLLGCCFRALVLAAVVVVGHFTCGISSHLISFVPRYRRSTKAAE